MQDQISIAGLQGTVRVFEHGDVRIHTYISPEDGLLTNTPIVEGPNKLIIFDGQFFLPYAREVAIYAKSLEKPVERIVLSHIHLDHWSGLSALSARFPDAPIYAPRGVAEYLRANGPKILDARRSAFGDRIPQEPTIPTHVLPEGAAMIDDIRFEFLRFVDAESALQLVAIMPDQRTLLAFDLAFASSEHVFTVTSHFDNWMQILAGLKVQPTYDVVLSGHGQPTDRSAIDATIAYLRKGKEMYAASTEPETYARRMKAAFPDREHPGWIDLSASLLYSVIDAYDTIS
jgi:glyoxylase-like metal-dependent hydrolase (beta-lactamase superfamily II)